MRRPDVMNSLLSVFRDPDYLEIGVNAGQTFLEINAATRTAVDPAFAFDTKPHATASTVFYEVTSDEFFGSINAGRRYDVVYLDGLHTFDQTTRDLVNALSLLKPSGIIAIDDVLPNSFHASLPDLHLAAKVRESLMPDSQDYSWMGDVYKLVYFVRDYVPQYSYATIADNHGQLVMWREPRMIYAAQPIENIARAGFETVIERRSDFHISPMSEIMERLAKRL